MIYFSQMIQIYHMEGIMKKITLRAQAWVVVAGRGLTVLLATLYNGLLGLDGHQAASNRHRYFMLCNGHV